MKKITTQLLLTIVVSCLLFGNVAAQDQGGASFLEEGVQQLYAEEYQEAIDNFQKAKEENPDDGIVYYYLGYAYSFTDQLSKAEENLEKAKELFDSQGNEEGIKAAEGILETLEN
ncbi:MAG: tetratricopeptide repeat protein [Candidatus Omnitrophota bacterium]